MITKLSTQYLEFEAVVSRLFVFLLDVVVITSERGTLVHEEVRRRLQLAGTEDALAAVESRELVEAMRLVRILLRLLLRLLLLGLEKELSPVALAQLQRLPR